MGLFSVNTLITPFQFSSRKLQYQTLLGFNINNQLASDLFHSVFSWYEMWVNPETVNLTTKIINSGPQHTAGSIVTYHYRKDVTVMQVSGRVGYIAIQSRLEEARNSFLSGVIEGNFATKFNSSLTFGKNQQSRAQRKKNQTTSDEMMGFYTGNRNRLNNSPRLFLKRLRNLAEDPMYYVDSKGIEHYNTKFIKIFTKQYPDGLICEGYFNNFNVPESSDQPMTIEYNFEFIIENTKPITLLQRMAGMFAGTGSVAGDLVRLGY